MKKGPKVNSPVILTDIKTKQQNVYSYGIRTEQIEIFLVILPRKKIYADSNIYTYISRL